MLKTSKVKYTKASKYSVGDIVLLHCNYGDFPCIIAQYAPEKVTLIALESGNRWYDGDFAVTDVTDLSESFVMAMAGAGGIRVEKLSSAQIHRDGD